MIKYENWPIIVRVETAFSIKKFHIAKSDGIATIGYLFSILGIITILVSIIKSSEVGVFNNNLIFGIGCFLIGITHVIYGCSISWINKYSSWEERFNNKSLLTEKLGSILLLLISVLGLALVIKSSY